MKLVMGLLCALSFSAYGASTVLSNVTICATACNSGSLDAISKTSASYGSVFFSRYSPVTSTNTAACLKEASELSMGGDRGNVAAPYGIKEQECARILLGKYAGKKVNLVVEKLSNKTPYVLMINLAK